MSHVTVKETKAILTALENNQSEDLVTIALDKSTNRSARLQKVGPVADDLTVPTEWSIVLTGYWVNKWRTEIGIGAI